MRRCQQDNGGEIKCTARIRHSMSTRAIDAIGLAITMAVIAALVLFFWPAPWAAVCIGWELSVATDLLVKLGKPA